MIPIPKEEYFKQKEDEKKELLDKLKLGVKDVFTSEKYKKFLKAYSKFHNYSINNAILILMQKPNASYIASFGTWKTIGRKVNKGEKGIKVIVPIPYKYSKRIDSIKNNGEKVTEEQELQGLAFKVGNVFDIEQTNGKELPRLSKELIENSDDIKGAIRTVKQISPVPIYYDKPVGKSNGYYHIEDKYIALRLGMSDSQTFKTLIHEIAHAKLHTKKDVRGAEIDTATNENRVQYQPVSRAEREVQAESVAFLVCSKYGIDTSDYSFGYIAGYSSDKNTKELMNSLSVISKCADEITNSVDKELGIKSMDQIVKREKERMAR